MTTLTIRQAAEATGRDRRTIARRLAQGAYPGAYKDDAGVWQIPAEALDLDTQTPDAALLEADRPQAIEEIERPEGEVAALLRRAEVAEARAEERDRQIEHLTGQIEHLTGQVERLTEQMSDAVQALMHTKGARRVIEIEATGAEGRRRRWGRRRR